MDKIAKNFLVRCWRVREAILGRVRVVQMQIVWVPQVIGGGASPRVQALAQSGGWSGPLVRGHRRAMRHVCVAISSLFGRGHQWLLRFFIGRVKRARRLLGPGARKPAL